MEKENLYHYFKEGIEFNEDTLSELKSLTKEFPTFHAAVILYLKNLKELNHPDFEDELNRLSIRIPDRKLLFYFLHPEVKKTKFQTVMPKSGTLGGDYFSGISFSSESTIKDESLIDHFIASNPTFRINENNDKKSKGDYSENSIKENEEIISETFAELLVQQKKYDKALEAFEKLSLKNPEKSIYFAGRIKEIRNLMNN